LLIFNFLSTLPFIPPVIWPSAKLSPPRLEEESFLEKAESPSPLESCLLIIFLEITLFVGLMLLCFIWQSLEGGTVGGNPELLMVEP